jgi:dipeptidyl aminopeptidase/acylaminoacyl peptidase
VSILPPERATISAFSLSPDGSRIAFPLTKGGVTQVWVRPLASDAALPVAGSEGASDEEAPVWSPDSREFLFFAGRQLKKLPLAGGMAQVVCEADANGGAAWSREGVVLFTPALYGPLFRISAAGGVATKVRDFRPAEKEIALRRPFFLPDGRHFFYVGVKRPADRSVVYVGSLDHSESKPLFSTASGVQYGPPASGSIGLLFSLRESTLLARPFDQSSLRIVDDPVPAAAPVGADFLRNWGQFSISNDGLLAFSDSELRPNQLVWIDRAGRHIGTLGQPGYYNGVNISPDGRTVLVSAREGRTSDLYAIDRASAAFTRLTFGNGAESNRMPVWSRDGKRIVWTNTAADGTHYVMMKTFAGRAAPIALWATNTDFPTPLDWSPDGRHILFYFYPQEKAKHAGLFAVSLDATGKVGEPETAVRSPADEPVDGAALSPDGHSLAFGANALQLGPFPPAAVARQLAPPVAARPRWRRDGGEIYYWSPSSKQILSVDVRTSQIRNLFPVAFSRSPVTRPFDVTPDGQRFLVIEPVEEPSGTPISLLVNWRPQK